MRADVAGSGLDRGESYGQSSRSSGSTLSIAFSADRLCVEDRASCRYASRGDRRSASVPRTSCRGSRSAGRDAASGCCAARRAVGARGRRSTDASTPSHRAAAPRAVATFASSASAWRDESDLPHPVEHVVAAAGCVRDAARAPFGWIARRPLVARGFVDQPREERCLCGA